MRTSRSSASASTGDRVGEHRNGRSQTALERVGFRREGVLRGWHVHASGIHDVVVFGMLRAEWEASPLRAIPARLSGEAPAAWHCGEGAA